MSSRTIPKKHLDAIGEAFQESKNSSKPTMVIHENEDGSQHIAIRPEDLAKFMEKPEFRELFMGAGAAGLIQTVGESGGQTPMPTGLFDEDFNEDFHAWIEDKEGNVIFDPHFPEYDEIKKLQGLYGEPQYKAYTGEKARSLKMRCRASAKKILKTQKKHYKMTAAQVWEQQYHHPVYGYCNFNAIAYLKKHPDSVFKVGSMGWKRKCDDRVFWEFGDEGGSTGILGSAEESCSVM